MDICKNCSTKSRCCNGWIWWNGSEYPCARREEARKKAEEERLAREAEDAFAEECYSAGLRSF